MTKDKLSNIAASVHQRLLNIIRETGDDPNLVWTRYSTERLLYRLSISEYAGDFILKVCLNSWNCFRVSGTSCCFP